MSFIGSNNWPHQQWLTTVAAVILTSASALVGYHRSFISIEDSSLMESAIKWEKYFLRSVRRDFPLWVGSAWYLLRQEQPLSSSYFLSRRLLDMFAVGLLLTYREYKIQDNQDDDPPSDKSKTKKKFSEQERLDYVMKEMPFHHQQLSEKPQISSSATSSQSGQRYLELMVHNVSHTDLVLSLDAPYLGQDNPPAVDASFCLCRPRFSAFDFYSKKIATILPTLQESHIVQFPRYDRSDATPRYNIKPEPRSTKEKLPIGFTLSDHKCLNVSAEELKDLRVRGRDSSRLANVSSTKLNAVFFPLLATLMPQWQAMIRRKYHGSTLQPKQVLILVSGVGTPRNWTHSISGNSTNVCAQLMQQFLQTLYPNLVVVQIHSKTNIFRYDENISFVQNELMPCIQSYRDAHAKGLPYPDEVKAPSNTTCSALDDKLPFMSEWKKSFQVTLSYADGSPARNHAIQAALRPYRPAYYHCWQLKTFWHESKIVDSDIEVHSFEEMETLPALSTNQLQDKPLVMQVVDEIKSFSSDMTNILSNEDNDVRKFWLRKTHKPVLAVLAVQLESGKIKLYRGTNMEVSMPTGSLCAERNVIGTALADNPALKRQDLKVIAVLSVPPPQQPGELPRSTSVASLITDNDVKDDQIGGISDLSKNFGNKRSNLSSVVNTMQDEGWILQDLGASKKESNPPASTTLSPPFFASDTPPLHPNPSSSTTKANDLPPSLLLGPSAFVPPPSPSGPTRRIQLYSTQVKMRNVSHSRKRTVVVHSDEDLNPLRPCGACNEWLKKIAESNPYFQILTFTDAECNGVYCDVCDE